MPLASNAELLALVIDTLAGIAPDARDQPLNPELPLRDQLDLDSMDHLHFLIALKQRFGVDIPEAEYGRMRRLSELVSYLAAQLSSRT